MAELIQVLSLPFMQHALLAALLASLACGMIGSLVVVNRLVFMSGGIAHAAYGGVGLAFFLGLPVLPCTVGFTLGASLLMGVLTLKRQERTDTLIGVLWAAGMAVGILLLDLTPGYNVDLMSYLFGSLLAVPGSDLWLMSGLVLLVLACVGWFYRDLQAFSFDREFAATRGIPVTLLHFLLLAMVALSVVMIIRVVGLILVIALLTIPAHLAERLTTSLASMMLMASGLSALFCLSGLFLAYLFDLTSGASIIAVATTVFLGVLGTGIQRGRPARA